MFIPSMQRKDFLSNLVLRISMWRLLFLLIVFVIDAISPSQVFAAGANSSTTQSGLETTTFGPIGIVAGQTFRLSAVRTFDGLVDTVCSVNLSIFDLQGNKQAEQVSENLKPGQGASVDLAWAGIMPPPNGAQAEVDAIVDLTRDSKGGEPTCHVATSIQVLDQASGRILIYQDAPSQPSEQLSRMPQAPNVKCVGVCTGTGMNPCPPKFECWCDPKIEAKFICCDGRPTF